MFPQRDMYSALDICSSSDEGVQRVVISRRKNAPAVAAKATEDARVVATAAAAASDEPAKKKVRVSVYAQSHCTAFMLRLHCNVDLRMQEVNETCTCTRNCFQKLDGDQVQRRRAALASVDKTTKKQLLAFEVQGQKINESSFQHR